MELTFLDPVTVSASKESAMGNNKNPNKKRPGEKEPGTFHYNPGNMSGKTVDICKDESEQRTNVERIQNRRQHRDKKS